jgi:hypothetical protein
MGTTQKTLQRNAVTKQETAMSILGRIGLCHINEFSSSAIGPDTLPNAATGFYSFRSCPDGALSPHLKIIVSIPQSAGTTRSQEAERFDFSVLAYYGPDPTEYVDVYGKLSSPAHDIDGSVSDAVRLAKQFQSPDCLQKFLRGSSDKAWQQLV